MQSRLSSLVEVSVNTASGFLISLITSAIIFPMFGFTPSVGQNVQIVGIFTVVSIVRSYVWRRVFNRIHSTRRS